MALRCACALSLTLLIAGCAGAQNADLFNGDPGEPPSSEEDISATEPAPSNKHSAKPNQPAAPTPPTAAPQAPTPPATPDPEPAPTCTQEAEPNNDLNHGTTFTTSFCGKIDSNSDVDYARFVVPAGSKQISINHSEQGGKVSYRYYIDGILLPLAGDGMLVIPGMTYSVQMKLSASSNANDRPTYALDISFK